MNGRIYDPLLGRFLSADIAVQFPSDLQSYNRYSYVGNNPLNRDDPSGYFLNFVVGAVVGAVVDAGAQVAGAMISGKSFSEAVKDVDLGSVATSAVLGATGTGLGQVLGKAGATVGGKLAAGAVEGTIEGVANGDSVVSSALGGAVGNVVGEAAGDLAKKAAGAAIDAGGDAIKKLAKNDVEVSTSTKNGGIDSSNAPSQQQTDIDSGSSSDGNGSASNTGDKTYQTYTKPAKDPSTHGDYNGRTSGTGTPQQNVANRDKNHHMNETHGPAELDKSSSNSAAIRGREQTNIENAGGAQSQGGTSGNAINGISDKNKKKQFYHDEEKREFGGG